MRFRILTAALVAFIGFALPARGALLDANFTDTLFANDSTYLNQISGIGWAPDGSNRLFVIRKTGQVMIIQNGTILTTPFATLSSVYTNSECGLIGFTFDPSFASNGFIYFFVTVSATEQQILRYTASGNTGGSFITLKSGLPTRGLNHDGGAIGVGPDGKLYWAIGDNGNGTGVDADLTLLAAKISRSNRDGTLPADNPFNDGAGPNNDFIWGRGYRNPFTMTFQPGTGKLWMNVVGTGYEQVFIATKGGNAGYNDYENNQPADYLTPAIKYVTNGSDSRTVAAGGASRSSNVVTFTTTAAHGFRKGEKIAISGVSNSSFNGSVFVATVPSSSTFTAVQSGSNATSGGGTAATLNQGGCITGGAFWDSSAAPAAYRGNFFYGDFNSGRMMRAILDGSNEVGSVDYFSGSSHIPGCVDTSIGPDGAIYSASENTPVIRRAAFNASSQGLVVTPTILQADEAGRTAFSVRLAMAPVANTVVSIARTSGDADLTVFTGAALTFTPLNFATPQGVTLAAAADADATNDTAVFTVSAPSITSQTVNLTALDDDAPVLAVSTTTLAVNEGASAQFGVSLTGSPAAVVSVTVSRTAGDADITVTGGSSLTFTSANFATPQMVTIAAAEDGDASADSATISVQGGGFVTQTVSVSVTDNEAAAPVFTSTPVTTAVVNAPYSYQAAATGPPAPAFSLVSPPVGMTVGSSSGLVAWTPAATGTFNITLRANNGIPPIAQQAFAINVVPDNPPVAVMTRPYAGAIVSGTNAEWFGTGIDDVGCVQARFYVDNALVDTDINTGNHYHFGGAHSLWNTTTLSDGGHQLKIVVTDTAGHTGSTERGVIVANTHTPLEAWRLAKFSTAELLDPAISGNHADTEGDGFVTLMEYALGLEPKQHDAASQLPVHSIQTIAGLKYLTLTYLRPIDGRPDLLYLVGVSNDFIAWDDSSSATTLVSVTPGSDGKETVIVRDNLPTGNQPSHFIRLKARTTN